MWMRDAGRSWYAQGRFEPIVRNRHNDRSLQNKGLQFFVEKHRENANAGSGLEVFVICTWHAACGGAR